MSPFRGLRLRLTLWYSAVLALALCACGLLLYVSLRDLTLSPIRERLTSLATFGTQEWQRAPSRECGSPPPPPGRPPSGLGPAMPVYVVCFDPTGSEIARRPLPSDDIPNAFADNSLVSRAIQHGVATDVLEGAGDSGPILGVAAVAIDPRSGTALGVVQVGQSIAVQWATLQTLRHLLLLIALGAVATSAFVGLVLADRALEPARIAFARQQSFIADASHQLRTPLTLLRADAEVLLMEAERSPNDRELLEDIVAEAAHMDVLTTNLLTLARLDAGEHHLELEAIDLGEFAHNISSRFGSLAKQRRIDVCEDLAPATLVADQHLLEQAALVLVDNAIKYTPPGGTITLRTGTRTGCPFFSVEDNGIGIASTDLPGVAERFYRVDPARSHKQGSGLGLAIARGIAATHGGSLEIQSVLGEGTSVTLSFPSGIPRRAGSLRDAHNPLQSTRSA
jgi:signal transduction histidine kinase